MQLVAVEARLLQNTYAHAIDSRDWELFRTVFAPDVVADYPRTALRGIGGVAGRVRSVPRFVHVDLAHDEQPSRRTTTAGGVWASCYGDVRWQLDASVRPVQPRIGDVPGPTGGRRRRVGRLHRKFRMVMYRPDIPLPDGMALPISVHALTNEVTNGEPSHDRRHDDSDEGVYYDPYDFEIDTDPYPIWKRLRDEAPLYYNEKYDFYAVSRFDDVERGSIDWHDLQLGQGHAARADQGRHRDARRASIIFEDPPSHDVHRGLLSRVFTPRKMNAIEPKVREFCAPQPRPARRQRAASTSSRDLGAQMPMRTIGMLLGIPEADQEAIRDQIDDGPAPRGRRRCPTASTARRMVTEPRRVRRVHRLAGRAPVRRPDDRAAPSRVRGRARRDAARSPRRGARLRQPARRRRQRDHDPAHRLDGQGARRAPRPAARARRGPRRSSRTRSRRSCATRRRRRCRRATCTQDVEHYGQTVPGGQRRCCCSTARRTATTASSPTATASTSTARSTTT